MLTTSYQVQIRQSVRKYDQQTRFYPPSYKFEFDWIRFKDFKDLAEARRVAKKLSMPNRIMKTMILNIKKQMEVSKDE